jgi:hypothetical protein
MKKQKSSVASAKKTVTKKLVRARSVKTGHAKKKARSKRSAVSTTKESPIALTTTARRRLLKPRDDFAQIVEKTVKALGERRDIRVPGTNATQLKSLTERAVRAAAREERMRAKLEAAMRPLSDARLLAEDAAYRALLDVYAAVKLYGRSDPKTAAQFAFLADHLTFSRERATEVAGGAAESSAEARGPGEPSPEGGDPP